MKAEPAELQALLQEQGHLRSLQAAKARLKKISLTGVDLSHACFSGADLSGADLSLTRLDHADLSGCNLSGANLSGACLEHADLHKARLRDADLSDATLADAQLTRANLSGAKLNRTNLERAKAQDAELSRISGEGATFKDADLSRVNLGGAKLSEPDFTGARLEEAFLERTSLIKPRLGGANLQRANLVNLELRFPGTLAGANLKDVDLAEAELEGVSFEGADLSGAILDQVLLKDVSFVGARLERTDFQGVKGLSEEDCGDIRIRGGIVDALFFERAYGFFRQSRVAQGLLGLVVLVGIVGVFLYFHDPSYRPIDTLLVDAQNLRDQGKQEEAIALYDLLLERVEGKTAQEIAVLNEKAEALTELERYEDAADAYGSIVLLAEDDRDERVNAQLKQASALAEGGRQERAVELVKAITDDETNSPKDVARALLALSQLYQKMGLEDRALEIFQETIERFPHDPEVAFDVNLQMCEVYVQRQQYGEAEVLLEKLGPMARDDSQRVALLILKARLYEGKGEREKSLATFEELIKRYPANLDISPEVKMDLARLMEDKGEYDWAVRVYKDILARVQDNLLKSQAQIAYGALLKRMGRTDEAIELFRHVRRQATNNQELQGATRLEEADTLVAMQRYDDAFALLDEAIRSSEPGLAASALLRRGQLLVELGRVEEATSTFEQVISTFSTQTEVVITAKMDLARMQAARGNGEAAIPIYEKLIADPAAEAFRSHLLNDLGHTYADLQRMSEAERVFQQLLTFQDDPEAVANARFGLARLAVARGDRREAANLYQKVAEEVSDLNLKVSALDALARMYSDAGEVGPAIDAYQQILSIVPPRHDAAYSARQGMAQLFQRQGELDKAESLYKGIADDADRPDVRASTLLELGSLYLDKGDPNRAETVFKEIQEKYSSLAESEFRARVGLAEAYRQQGAVDKAIRALRDVVSRTSDPKQAAQALDVLSQLYQQNGQPEEAMKVGQEMLGLAGQDPEARLNAQLAMAAALREKGSYEEALAIYTSLGKSTSDRNLRLTVLDAQAQAYTAMGKFDEAADSYDAIVRDYKDNLDIYHNAMMGLANARRGQGRLEDAAELYQRVARETIDQGMRQWALQSAAQTFSESGQGDKARELLATVGDENPPADDDRLGQASLLRTRGDRDGALELYRQTAKTSSDPSEQAWALVFAAQILTEEEKGDEALESYQKVVDSFPGEVEPVLTAKLGIAGIFRARNHLMEASARYEDVARGDSFPDYRVSAALSAAEVYMEQKLLAKARTHYEDILKRFPDRPEGLQSAKLGLAEIALATGQTDKALEAFTDLEANATLPQVRADAMAGMVQAYARRGDRDKATKAFETLKEKYPSETERVAGSLVFLNE